MCTSTTCVAAVELGTNSGLLGTNSGLTRDQWPSAVQDQLGTIGQMVTSVLTDVLTDSDGGLPSLDEVRKRIPERCYRRSMGRGLGLVAIDSLVYLGLIGLAIWSDNWLPGLALSVLAGIAVSAMFVIGHDAAHDALLPSDRGNRLVALLFMLPSLHVRDGWVFGHNRVHHGFTVKRGLDFVWHPVTPAEYVQMSGPRRLLHRLEWSWAGAGVYYLRNVWWNKMIRFTPPTRSAPGVPRDRRIIVSYFVAVSSGSLCLGWYQHATVLSALWMWGRIVVIPFLVFSWIIGATVHIHHVQPDIQWYDAKDWTRSKAQLIGTTVMRAPWFIDVALHHIFIHVPHHVDARIPCYRLSKAAKVIDEAYPGVVQQRSFRFSDYIRATKACKLFDFETSQWVRTHGLAG